MAQIPFESLFHAYASISRCVQNHFSHLFLPLQSDASLHPSLLKEMGQPLFSDEKRALFHRKNEAKASGPLTKEDLGRATWTLLHSIAAQYPDQPTRQQKRDAKELISIVSRLYPCKECADHFKEVLKANPVQAGSHEEFSQWLCHLHNIVNRSLGKLIFPCNRVNGRWGKLDCPARNCDLHGTPDMSIQQR